MITGTIGMGLRIQCQQAKHLHMLPVFWVQYANVAFLRGRPSTPFFKPIAPSGPG